MIESGTLLNLDLVQPDHRILHLQLPDISRKARPGALIRIGPYEFPIIRCHPQRQRVQLLCDADTHNVLASGPVTASLIDSRTFCYSDNAGRALLMGENLGIAPIVYLAEQLKNIRTPDVALLGFVNKLPFRPHPSRMISPGFPADAIATMPLLESWDIPCRIAVADDQPGCYCGYVESLAAQWLDKMESLKQDVKALTLYASGGQRLVNAADRLAKQYALRSQIIQIN